MTVIRLPLGNGVVSSTIVGWRVLGHFGQRVKDISLPLVTEDWGLGEQRIFIHSEWSGRRNGWTAKT